MASAEEVKARLDAGCKDLEAVPLTAAEEYFARMLNPEYAMELLGQVAAALVATKGYYDKEMGVTAERIYQNTVKGSDQITQTLLGATSGQAQTVRKATYELRGLAPSIPMLIDEIDKSDSGGLGFESAIQGLGVAIQFLGNLEQTRATVLDNVGRMITLRGIVTSEVEIYKDTAL